MQKIVETLTQELNDVLENCVKEAGATFTCQLELQSLEGTCYLMANVIAEDETIYAQFLKPFELTVTKEELLRFFKGEIMAYFLKQWKTTTSSSLTEGQRYYLDALQQYDYRLDFNDARVSEWQHQRATYGFDERETWSLNRFFYAWLYERLLMFNEKASQHMDLTLHSFEFNYQNQTQILTLQVCIDEMIRGCEIALTKGYSTFDGLTEEEALTVECVLVIFKEVVPCLWW